RSTMDPSAMTTAKPTPEASAAFAALTRTWIVAESRNSTSLRSTTSRAHVGRTVSNVRTSCLDVERSNSPDRMTSATPWRGQRTSIPGPVGAFILAVRRLLRLAEANPALDVSVVAARCRPGEQHNGGGGTSSRVEFPRGTQPTPPGCNLDVLVSEPENTSATSDEAVALRWRRS